MAQQEDGLPQGILEDRYLLVVHLCRGFHVGAKLLLAIFRSSLLGPHLTAPTLEFSIVNKICDFSNFSQFLQLCANLDISL